MDGNRDIDLTLDAEHRLTECEVDRQLGVEEVAQAARTERVALSGAAGSLPEDASMAEAVVASPSFGVTEDLVGEADLLEVLVVLRAGVVGVRVELPCLRPVGTLQLLVGGVTTDAEELVEIGVGHRVASPRRSPSRCPTTVAAARASG